MKQHSVFDLLRVWAALTGLLLATVYFGALYLGLTPWPVLPLLVAGVGGFELFLCVQDRVLARKAR